MPGEPTMKLRCKVGPYAGHVLEYPKSVGENLLMTGQAEWPAEEAQAPVAERAVRPGPETRTERTETMATPNTPAVPGGVEVPPPAPARPVPGPAKPAPVKKAPAKKKTATKKATKKAPRRG